ncbi:hypothetical protein LXL04_005289 [Taraxacum kok-saghyz]
MTKGGKNPTGSIAACTTFSKANRPTPNCCKSWRIVGGPTITIDRQIRAINPHPRLESMLTNRELDRKVEKNREIAHEKLTINPTNRIATAICSKLCRVLAFEYRFDEMDQNIPTTDHHNKDLHLRFLPPPISSDSWEKPDEFLAGRMDRSHWMYKLKRSDDGYLTRLAGFLKVAEENRLEKGESYIWCPCVDCKNCQKSVYVKVEENLIFRGFMPDYICWSRHGEMMVGRNEIHLDLNGDNDDLNNENCDNLSGMLHDCEYDIANEDYDKFRELFDESEKPLYDGCTKYTKLSAVLKLFNLKANSRWSDTSFTSLLKFINDVLPEGNEMPISTYQAKKLLCPINQYADLHNCITCGTSRYKRKTTITENSSTIKNGPPAKVLWYLPIIQRLKRLFANPKDAKLLRWHAEERKIDGKIRHVADSPQWRNIDSKFQELGEEIRNIRSDLVQTDLINLEA